MVDVLRMLEGNESGKKNKVSSLTVVLVHEDGGFYFMTSIMSSPTPKETSPATKTRTNHFVRS